MNRSTIAISACIICKNEAHRITATLDSLNWCQDIVVVDSGSSDNTMELAQIHPTKPRVLRQPWLGFNGQRKFAAEQCAHPWVLMLDADEECSPELAGELQHLDLEGLAKVGMLKMPRRNYLGGRYVRCWSPDYQQRFIHKERMDWDPRPLPEIRTPKPGFLVKKLKGSLLHGRVGGNGEQILREISDGQKMAAYAELLAGNLRQRGQRATWLNLIFRPLLTFIKYYILRGGFLDGRFGLIIAYKTTIGVILKYSVLWALENNPSAPPPAPTTEQHSESPK